MYALLWIRNLQLLSKNGNETRATLYTIKFKQIGLCDSQALSNFAIWTSAERYHKSISYGWTNVETTNCDCAYQYTDEKLSATNGLRLN